MAKLVDRVLAVRLRRSDRARLMVGRTAFGADPPPVVVNSGTCGRHALPVAFPRADGRKDSALPLAAGLGDFYARAIVDREIDYTVVGGHFWPSGIIDLSRHSVILCVSGLEHLRLSLSPASFRETGLGGYVASNKCGSYEAEILLQPLSCGGWAYAASIRGFVPGSTFVSVSLTVGGQAGRTSAEVFEFSVPPATQPQS